MECESLKILRSRSHLVETCSSSRERSEAGASRPCQSRRYGQRTTPARAKRGDEGCPVWQSAEAQRYRWESGLGSRDCVRWT